MKPDNAARVLDPCCGSRMMWFDRENPDVIFGDQRRETITVTDRSHGNESGTRTLHIEPDVLMDFREIPYPDGTFKLVSFDPPHLVRAGPKSWLAAKYGKLGPDWREDIRKGFAECFRVLMPDGVLVFKWNETQVKICEVLELTPIPPLFGHRSGRKGLTHWIVFMKPKHLPLPAEIERWPDHCSCQRRITCARVAPCVFALDDVSSLAVVRCDGIQGSCVMCGRKKHGFS